MKQRALGKSGIQASVIGLGTWQIPEGAAAYDATRCALRSGYRHVGTARAYGNEASVGRAVRDSGLPRDEVFVTSKLPAEIKTADGAMRAFEATMTMQKIDISTIEAARRG